MNSLLNFTIANAISVIPLALIAAFVSWRVRRASLQHAVWVLVLLKFVTPPVFSLPVNLAILPEPLAIQTAESVAPPSQISRTEANAVPQSSAPKRMGPARDDSHHPAKTPSTSTTSAPPIPADGNWFSSWSSLALTLWLTGSLLWIALQLFRAIRFETLISYRSRCPEELQSQCSELAHQFGIMRAPRVCMIEAAISPMLWGMGSRAKLLFPAKLAARMNAESRATLLMHELAHYRRGDHLVRLLELFATGLFWWHPILWIARRQIEQAEEECCDAWVVEQFPKAPRRYAEALLDTIDFLCESRRALPPLASGLGQAPFLRRRLIQIMAGATIPPLSHSTRCGLLLMGSILLPIQPFVLRAAHGNRVTNRLPETLVTTVGGTWDPLSTDPLRKLSNPPPTDVAAEQPQTVQPQMRKPPRPPRTRKNGEVWSTAVSSDGRFVIRVYTIRRVTLTDMQNSTVTELPSTSIAAVAFSPDGRWFVSAGHDGRVLRWNATSGEIERVLLEHPATLNTIAISPEGDRIAVGGRAGQVAVLSVDGQAALRTWTAPAAVNCVRFSPNGRNLAVSCGEWAATSSGQVVLYDADTGRVTHQKRSITTGAIAFASDEELILGGWTGQVQLWNLASNEIVAEGAVDKNVVAAAAFSPDNPGLREAALLPTMAKAPSDSTFSFLQELLEQVP